MKFEPFELKIGRRTYMITENYVIPLDLSVWLSNSVSYCLSDYGFAEFFQAATNYQLRV